MLDQHTGTELIAYDDRRNQRHAFPLAGEEAKHRHVIDFG